VSHPAARPGVTTGPASPLGVAMPFSVFSVVAVAAHRIRRALLRPWNLTDPGPWSLPTPTALPVVSEQVAHPLLGFHSPTGYGRSQPWHREPYHAWSSDRCHPSPGVLVPSAVVSTRDPVTPMTFHVTGTLRPQGSSPSRRLAPSRAFRRLPAGPLLGFQPSRLCSCRQVRRPFGHVPSLPDVTHPDRRTLAMTIDRTRFYDEGISPRERSE
jgi:hypothetical protein